MAESPAVAPESPAATQPDLEAEASPANSPFVDGAAARRAANVTHRLDGPLPVVAPRPSTAPSIDLEAQRKPRTPSMLQELRRLEPQTLRRWRNQLIGPLIASASRVLDPATHRHWIRGLMMQRRSDVVDDFGLDPVYAEHVRPLFEFLYRTYWRVDARGLDHVPDHGRTMVVANHSGTLPYDAAMLMYALRYDHAAHRTARPLVEDFVFHFPFLGVAMNRIGGVRASQENAERLLAEEQLVVVFPEGSKGIGKLYRERYRLQRFGRGGFVKLAMRTRTPIVPAAVVGAEEIHPMLTKVTWLAKSVGIPYIPITPSFPWLGPLGALPLPSKWAILFGAPIDPAQEYGQEAINDRILVNRITEQVRSQIQTMVDDLLARRESTFLG